MNIKPDTFPVHPVSKESPSPKKLNEGLVLFILAAINFTHIMDFVIVAPLNPFLKEVFLIDTRQFGLLMSAYTLSAGVFGFLGFFFIDRFDRKKALLIFYAGFGLSNLLCALSESYYLFMAARVVAGAFGGIVASLVLSVVGDAIPQERRGKATGIVMSAFAAASIIGIPTGLYLSELFSWHAPFVLLTVLSAIVLTAVALFFPPMRGHLEKRSALPPLELLMSILSIRNVQWSLLFMVLLMLGGFTVVPFLSDYMVNNIGLPKQDLRYIYLFGGLGSVVTGPVVGKLSDKYGKQRVFIIAAIVSIIPMALITNLGQVAHWLVFSVSTLFFIFFGGRFVPAMAMITSSVEARNRGKFMSISSCVQQLSSALASFIGGIVIVNSVQGKLLHFDTVGYIAIAATLLCIIVSFKVKPVS